MIYATNIFFILLGLFIIGNSAVSISDEYRATHPLVERKYHGAVQGENIRFFVKGTFEWEPSGISAAVDWEGDKIRLRVAPPSNGGKP